MNAVVDNYDVQAIETLVRGILSEHRISNIPINPLQIAKSLNIDVTNAEFVESNISGMISKVGNTFTIYVKHDDPPNRKRFTIAHELGHYFLHLKYKKEDETFVDKDINFFRGKATESSENRNKEVEANRFAAELLMPADFIKREWDNSNVRSVDFLAKKFQVSPSAMGYRLVNLGLIQRGYILGEKQNQIHDKSTIVDAQSFIKKDYGQVREEEIQAYERVTEADLKKYKTRMLIDTWKDQQKDERVLRKNVAHWILIGLFIQFIIGNIAWFLIGFRLMEFDKLVVNLFFVGMYTQLVTITLIVVKNLFPNTKKGNITEVNDIIKIL